MRSHSAQLGENLSGLSMEHHRRPPPRQAPPLNVLPSPPPAPSRPDGLHARFFGRETRGVALCLVGLRFAIPDLVRRENPLLETSSKARDGLLNPLHFPDVDAGSHDHATTIQHLRNPIPIAGMALLLIREIILCPCFLIFCGTIGHSRVGLAA